MTGVSVMYSVLRSSGVTAVTCALGHMAVLLRSGLRPQRVITQDKQCCFRMANHLYAYKSGKAWERYEITRE